MRIVNGWLTQEREKGFLIIAAADNTKNAEHTIESLKHEASQLLGKGPR